jgi:hypothetical protein
MAKSFEDLKQACDFNPKFTELMLNRMVVGYAKYGSWKVNRYEVDIWKNIETRWNKYRETGNTEFLIDLANFAMMEFSMPLHPDAHFKPTDSNEAPAIKKFD